jgi:hypothetical protein
MDHVVVNEAIVVVVIVAGKNRKIGDYDYDYDNDNDKNIICQTVPGWILDDIFRGQCSITRKGQPALLRAPSTADQSQ